MSLKIKNDTFTTFDDLWNESSLLDEEKREIELKVELLGKVIEARENKGITQTKLAEMTGLKQPAIARLESGQSIPKINTLIKLLTKLGYKLTIVPAE